MRVVTDFAPVTLAPVTLTPPPYLQRSAYWAYQKPLCSSLTSSCLSSIGAAVRGESTPTPPSCSCTGAATSTRVSALIVGADDYLTKPFEPRSWSPASAR